MTTEPEPVPLPRGKDLAALLAAQDGIVARAQLVELGWEPHDSRP